METIIIIPIILYCIGGIFDALMDTCSDHFSVSIFKNLNPNYWSKSVSWTNKYIDNNPSKGLKKWWIFNKPTCLTDAWHLFKTLKEIFNGAAITCAIYPDTDVVTWLITFVLVGIARDIIFVVLYDYALKQK